MGKRFDFDSNKARMLAGLRKDANWPLILGNGTVGNLIDVIANSRAEDARYMEYLLNEKKWTTAMNMGSLQAMGDLISYKRQLPQSAIGYVIVSHTDAEGGNRLGYYGSYYFELDAVSDYDDLTRAEEADESARHALVPWTTDRAYSIPKGTRFVTGSGVEYFATESISSRTLKKKFSTMSDIEKNAFYERGGWNGIKYLKIPVMQGIQKTVSIGQTSKDIRFQSFVLPTIDVDAGSNEISCKYFSVHVQPFDGGKPVVFTEINHLTMASAIDNVFEKSILKDESGIKIKFGDGVSGAIPPDGILYVDYVETLGAAGNLEANFQVNTMIFPSGYSLKDPRTDTERTFLSCTNISSIKGGKNIEDIDDFRKNAPASYLKSYTIATNKAYLDAIQKYSPLNLLHTKIFTDKSVTSEQLNIGIGENVSDSVANEIHMISDNINITSMLSNGELIDDKDVEETFLNPIQISIYDMKGPSDTIKFVQPNLIEIMPSIIVTSSSYDYTENDIKDYISEIISEEYNIFNQDFNEPIYNSKFVALAKSFAFTDTVSVMVEAVANVHYDQISTFNTNDLLDSSQYIVKIPFSFDEIYMQDLLNQGFKDCTVNADYLLKVNLEFVNDMSKLTNNRTFFLYDNRIDESGNTTIYDAKKLLDSGEESENVKIGEDNYTVMDKNFENFASIQSRVAQFDYIDKITDVKYMQQLKNFSLSPVENRPYETDGTGKYKLYSNLENTSGYTQIGNQYYKNNSKYIHGVDIDFNMNVDEKSLTGTVFIPLSYFGFTSLSNIRPDNDVLISLMRQYVNLRIYAQPKMTDFLPLNKNDIIYVNKDYIKVEKVQTTAN